MQKIELPVAFFDSGLGGISVLRETVRLLPQEDYLYFGDSLHAPYGVKSVDEVVRLSLENAAMLTARGIKALVVACNTVTSAAIATLREHYPQLPIIGTEPALKPAVERHPGGRILVMATAMTLSERKFSDLRGHYQQDAEIIPLACSALNSARVSLSSYPMASPVDFISGDRYASSPRSLENENAGTLTYHRCFSAGYSSKMPCSFSDSPSIARVPMSARLYPVDFDRNGTVRDERGLTSMIYTFSSASTMN